MDKIHRLLLLHLQRQLSKDSIIEVVLVVLKIYLDIEIVETLWDMEDLT